MRQWTRSALTLVLKQLTPRRQTGISGSSQQQLRQGSPQSEPGTCQAPLEMLDSRSRSRCRSIRYLYDGGCKVCQTFKSALEAERPGGENIGVRTCVRQPRLGSQADTHTRCRLCGHSSPRL